MTSLRRRPGARQLQGFSLVELMVSLTIGLLISIASFSAYLGAAGASKMAEAQGRMNEDAQAALIILTQQLRMAGSNPNQADRTDASRHNPLYQPYAGATFSSLPTSFTLSSFSIRGCDGPFQDAITPSSLDQLVCGSELGQPDAVAVSYEADRFNTVATRGSNLPSDCLGHPLRPITASFASGATTAPYYIADNRFYIGASANNVAPSLYCKGNGLDSTPLGGRSQHRDGGRLPERFGNHPTDISGQ